MKTRFIFATTIFSLFFSSIIPGTTQAQTRPNPKLKIEIPKLVARVNGVDIESKYIKFRLSKIEMTVNRPLTVKEKTSIVKDLIEKEIVRELVSQQGEKKNLKVDNKLIEKELESLEAAYSSEGEFKNALKARNISIEDIKKSMRIDFNARQLLNAQIKGKINISDGEVKNYYEDNKSKFHRPEAYHTRHILAAYFPPEALRSQTIEELKKNKEYFARIAEQKIDKVIEELKSGVDFEELAKIQSDDESSRENGGDLDFIYKGIFEASFDKAVSKLKPGETSEKIRTRFGFHVIQLIEKKPAEIAPFEEMKTGIQKYLFLEEAKKHVANYVEKLKQNAKIETFFNEFEALRLADEKRPREEKLEVAKERKRQAQAERGQPRQSQKKQQPQSGSGFFVSKMGHVITNAHVVQNCKKITIGDNANKQVPTELINTDQSNDLALLKLSTLEMASAESKSLIQKLGIVVLPLASKGLLRSEDVRLGEKVLVAGYPFGELFSNTIKVTSGIVSATRGAGDDSGQFQLDAAVQPGNSGGPIYDSGGNIVGVVISQLDKLKMAKTIGSMPENVNFGIKASTIRQFLTSSGLPSKKSERTEEKSTEQLAEIAQNQALMVMCLQ